MPLRQAQDRPFDDAQESLKLLKFRDFGGFSGMICKLKDRRRSGLHMLANSLRKMRIDDEKERSNNRANQAVESLFWKQEI